MKPLVRKPLVSVIMPVYNGEKYLEAAVRSVLESDYSELELLVVDDGSRDGSVEILQKFADHRLRLITNERNLGVAASLNRAIELSRGSFVARMDADDLCLRDRFSKQVEYLIRKPSVGILGGQARSFSGEPRFPKMPLSHEMIYAWSLFACPMIHPTVMWRRELDLRYTEYPPTAEDYDLWVRCLRKTRLENLNTALIWYRQDFGVKKKSYLDEQKKGCVNVRGRILDSLGLKDIRSREIHEKLSNLYGDQLSPGCREVAEWLYYLQEYNQKYEFIKGSALDWMLSRRWYDFHLSLSVQDRFSLSSFYGEPQLVKRVPILKHLKLWVLSISRK